jgi:hydroxylamine dehydrogenase
MSSSTRRTVVRVISLCGLTAALVGGPGRGAAADEAQPQEAATNADCVACHTKQSAALVEQWKSSRHSAAGVGCIECHQADPKDIDAWQHHGTWVAALVTPLDCGRCHATEVEEFTRSHHARAGEILASLDNVLAEKICGMPQNNADAVNGCWQCHGSIVTFKRDAAGQIERAGPEHKPVINPDRWPNSGIGRLNPDGSKGSCHACHSRHEFQAKLSRSPENCGKCHMGPDHPQIEIYNESKHGIAFYANRDRMALDKQGDWILGKDYFSAPTCATCHISGYMSPSGEVKGNSHDVGERISWTLRPIVSTKLNLVRFDDGTQEDYPDTRALPVVGATVDSSQYTVENDKLVSKAVPRKVQQIVTWKDRREGMKAVCHNCHSDTYIDNFYVQYDSLVTLFNEKFAVPSKGIIDEMTKQGLLNPKSPFGDPLQWTFYELWHHEGRRARHGASMMGPDYTHWHGMYEVAKHFYTKFLPEVREVAERGGKGEEWNKKVDALMTQDQHVWQKGMTPEEARALQKAYEQRYDEKAAPGK